MKYDDENYPERGHCKNCEKDVDLNYEDQGIGGYEYWGQYRVDHRWVYICSECGGDDVNIY